MSLEIKTKNRTAKVEVLEQNGSVYKVKIDDKVYEFDVEKVEEGVYSVLYENRSINMEMIEGDAPNKYNVNTSSDHYEIEVIDATRRYRSDALGDMESSDKFISSPMPGKVVKLLVSEGDKVEQGQTVIIISAMKMESEYKSPFDGVVKNIFVSEGDATEGGANLVEIEQE